MVDYDAIANEAAGRARPARRSAPAEREPAARADARGAERYRRGGHVAPVDAAGTAATAVNTNRP